MHSINECILYIVYRFIYFYVLALSLCMCVCVCKTTIKEKYHKTDRVKRPVGII